MFRSQADRHMRPQLAATARPEPRAPGGTGAPLWLVDSAVVEIGAREWSLRPPWEDACKTAEWRDQ